MNNKNEIKKSIDLALDLVKDIPSELQNTAFKLILQKMLQQENFSTSNDVGNPEPLSPTPKTNNPKPQLAKLCNVSVDELDNVFLQKGANIEILSKISGGKSFRMIVGSLVILAVRETIFNKEWSSSSEILTPLKKIGIEEKWRLWTYMSLPPSHHPTHTMKMNWKM